MQLFEDETIIVNEISRLYYLSKTQQILTAYASLLSSAQSLFLEEPILSKPEPALAFLLSSTITFDRYNPSNWNICSFPSFSLKNNITKEIFKESKQILNMQEAAAFNLSYPEFSDQENILFSPVKIINNFTESLLLLTHSRLRSSLVALNKKCEENAEVIFLNSLLKSESSSQSSPISVSTIVTSFRTVPLNENEDFNNDCNASTCPFLPLVFEATVDVIVLGVLVTIKINAPGTITGSINRSDELLERVEVLLDTIVLLKSMMKQARYIARKTIAIGATISKKTLIQRMPTIQKQLSNFFIPDNIGSEHSLKHRIERKLKRDNSKQKMIETRLDFLKPPFLKLHENKVVGTERYFLDSGSITNATYGRRKRSFSSNLSRSNSFGNSYQDNGPSKQRARVSFKNLKKKEN